MDIYWKWILIVFSVPWKLSIKSIVLAQSIPLISNSHTEYDTKRDAFTTSALLRLRHSILRETLISPIVFDIANSIFFSIPTFAFI